MADYVVDFLLGTGEMKKVLADAKTGATGGGGLGAGAGKGLKVIGMAAVVGVMMQLKAVSDTISFLLGTLSTGFIFLVSMFVQYITPFFKDPVRFFLNAWIDNTNMIIATLEFMTNAILGALTFGAVGGFGENKIEFPRFQKDIILNAYDDMKETIMSQEAGVGEIATSVKNFTNSFVEGFMTNTEYAELLDNTASESFGAVIRTTNNIGSLANLWQDAIDDAKSNLAKLSGKSMSGGMSTRYESPIAKYGPLFTDVVGSAVDRYNKNKGFSSR